MMLANVWPQINATFDHPQNIVFVHLLEIVTNCSRLYTSDWHKRGKADHLIDGSVHRCVTYNFSQGKFSTNAPGHRKGFSRILGSSEQPVKMSLPLRVGGGGGGRKEITKKCYFFLVCLTNAVPKKEGIGKILRFKNSRNAATLKQFNRRV